MHSQSQFAMAFCFIFLSILPLVASQTGGESFSSYSDWLDTVPSCAQDCLDSNFNEFLEACDMDPSSTSPSDLRCLCVDGDGGTSRSEAEEIGEETAQCALSACSSTTDQQQFGRSMLNLAEWCYDIAIDGVDSTTTSTSSSSDAEDSDDPPSSSNSEDDTNSEDDEDSGKCPVRLFFFPRSFFGSSLRFLNPLNHMLHGLGLLSAGTTSHWI